MRRLEPRRYWFVKPLVYLLGATLLCGYMLCSVLAHANGNETSSPNWASPNAMALRRVSSVDGAQHEPNFLNNLDCSLVDYRQAATGIMRTGCFTPTAYGLLDSDSDTVIFNGTDEGLPLLPYSSGQVLAPWPQALNLAVLTAGSLDGSYLSLYKNPLSSMQDQRNASLQLTAKQLAKPPELPLKDPAGKSLLVNPQTMAFSDSGSWLVAETLGGSFVRINLATLDVMAFAPSFGSQGSPALLKSQVAVSVDGRYVAIANTTFSSFKVYDLATCSGPVSGLQPRNCDAYDYWPSVRQKIAGFKSVRHLRFVNDGLLSFETQTGAPDSSGVYALAPRNSITSLIDYLGLGDSYTSGEGAFDYLSGTDTADNMCHLSTRSYPLLLTHELFSNLGGHSVACSGAVIRDIGSTNPDYRGQARGVATLDQLRSGQPDLLNSITANYLPGYIAQHQFVRQYQPAAITVSIGGNDIGFGDVLTKCVMPHVSQHLSDNTCYSTYEDRLELMQLIDRTVPRWTSLYKQLLAEAPGTRVYAFGYPNVVESRGNCAVNVHLSKSELEFAEELINYLNDSILQAAIKAGVSYVDINKALAGHRLCETASYNVAVNGLTAGTDSGLFGINVFGKESYHPNALGHALVEQAILDQTNGLKSSQASPSPVNSKSLLDAPKSGRTINIVMPDSNLTIRSANAGQAISIRTNGPNNGLKASSAYSIKLDGPGGIILGTANSDETGNISISVTLPSSTVNGIHAIDIIGQNQSGEPLDVTQPVYVTASDNDSDGDSAPNALDTCPGAANSGQDSDRDGIDDSCDGFIGLPPTNTPVPVNTSSVSLTARSLTVTTNRQTVKRKASDQASRTGNTPKVLGDNISLAADNGFQPLSKIQRIVSRPCSTFKRIGAIGKIIVGLTLILALLALYTKYISSRLK